MFRATYALTIIVLESVCWSVRMNEVDELIDHHTEEVEACAAFETHNVNVKDSLSGEKGWTGGQWSPCTHLYNYGLNFAPFLARFLAYQLAPQSALEFGCGLGTTSDAVARFSGADVTCIEPEPTLGQLIKSLREDAPGRGNLKQLALNVFSTEPEVSACTESTSMKKDLVFSFEVAEHIPAEHRPALIKFLTKSTGKWLVFSAARPGQAGTGHLEASMLPTAEWQRLFEEAGLVFMPKLTLMARSSSYPYRSYDLYANTLVFRSPDHNAADTDEPHEMLKHFREFWGEGENTKEWSESLHKFAKGHNLALWPQLTLLAEKVRSGEMCNDQHQAFNATAPKSPETPAAASFLENEAFTSAWAAHFYSK